MHGSLLHTAGTGTSGELTQLVTHVACSHDPGLHSALICACVRFVYTQPVTLLHVSMVHSLLSLHTSDVLSHTPVAGLHVYVSHASLC
jgi:hypothetical protein